MQDQLDKNSLVLSTKMRVPIELKTGGCNEGYCVWVDIKTGWIDFIKKYLSPYQGEIYKRCESNLAPPSGRLDHFLRFHSV